MTGRDSCHSWAKLEEAPWLGPNRQELGCDLEVMEFVDAGSDSWAEIGRVVGGTDATV